MDESSFPSFDLAGYDVLFSEFISYPELENNNEEPGLQHTSIPLELSNNLHPVHGTAERDISASPCNLSVDLYTSGTQITSLHQDPPYSVTQRTAPLHHLGQALPRKRPLSSDGQNPSSDLPGLDCWSLSGGHVPTRQPRSCFSKKRRKEVKNMRGLGACIRCRLLKRPCSGGDPCERCALAADAATKSKSLTWMDCIRPSFQAVDIFEKSNPFNEMAFAKAASNGFFDTEVLRNGALRSDKLVINLGLSTLARYLLNSPRTGNYGISTENFGNFSRIIGHALGLKLGNLSKALVHLSVHLYDKTAATDLHVARDQIGSRLLREIEARVKPSKLQSTQKSELHALFLVLLIALVACTLSSRESHTLEDPNGRTFSETKVDALERLLCHYIATIVQRLSYYWKIEYLLDIGEVTWTFPGHISCGFWL